MNVFPMSEKAFFKQIQLFLSQGEEYQNRGDYHNSISSYLEALDGLKMNFEVAPATVSIFFLSTCDKIAFSYYELETYEIASYYTKLMIDHLTKMGTEINEAIIKKNYKSKWLLDGLDIFKENMSWSAKLNYYSARNYYYLGMIAYEKKDFLYAQQYFKRTLILDENCYLGYYGQGLCDLARNYYEEAIKKFSHAIYLFPQKYTSYLNRAQTYYQIGQIENSLQDLETSFSLEQGNLIRYTKTLLLLKQIYLAVPDLEINGINKHKYPNVIDNLKTLKDIEDLVKDRIIKIQENNLIDMYDDDEYLTNNLSEHQTIIKTERRNLVINLSATNKLRKTAVIWASEALEYHSTNNISQTHVILACPYLSSYYFNRGCNSYAVGDIFTAIQDFSTAIQINPDNYPAYVERGTCYQKIFDFYSAINDYNLALKINEQDSITWHQLGFTYQKFYEYQQKFDHLSYFVDSGKDWNKKALKCYDNAIKFSDDVPDYFFLNRANCQKTLGNV